MHQALQGATFHVEHIRPVSRGGASDPFNLAVACPSCNFHKADRIEAIDPKTGNKTALFHPRNDSWSFHFEWHELALFGLTPVGRATLDALELNHPRRLKIREAESLFQLFPPGEDPSDA